MTSIIERIRRRKPEQSTTAQEPKPFISSEAQEVKPYPNTVIGVLRELKNASLNINSPDLQLEAAKAVQALSEIAQDGVSEFRKMTEKSNKPWEGRITFGGFAPGFGIDGQYYKSHEGIDIGRNGLLLFSDSYEMVGDVKEEISVQQRVSLDCKTVYRVDYSRTKTFNDETMIIEAVKARFRKNTLVSLEYVDTGIEQSGMGSFYKKPEGPIRKGKIIIPQTS